MKNNTFVVALVAFIAGGVVGYGVTSVTNNRSMMHTAKDTSMPAGMHRMPDGSMMSNGTTATDVGMMHGMDHGMMVVSSEKEFIEEMIPHHQEAVDTAKQVLARGATTPEIKKMM